MERHEHTHMVMIFRGKGQCLLGDTVEDVQEGDMIEIPKLMAHQFRANQGDHLGFLCLVNVDREKVQVITAEEQAMMKQNPAIKAFLESE